MSDPGTGGAPLPPPPGWQPPPPPPPSYAEQPAPGAPVAPAAQSVPRTCPTPSRRPGCSAPPTSRARCRCDRSTLGDMYDAAFRIIRFNPKATVGSAVLVSAVAWRSRSWSPPCSPSRSASPWTTTATATPTSVGLVGSPAPSASGACCSTFGMILVTGMISHVAGAAAIGRRLTLGEAWAATRGNRWRLIGLALLLGARSLLIVGAYVAALGGGRAAPATNRADRRLGRGQRAGVPVRPWSGSGSGVYYLPVPALMLEPVGVFGAIGARLRADPAAVLADLRHRAPDRARRSDRRQRARRADRHLAQVVTALAGVAVLAARPTVTQALVPGRSRPRSSPRSPPR